MILREEVIRLAVLIGAMSAARGPGQCGPAWDPGFGSPGTDASVNASVVHDDGSGPALYVAGDFGTAGGAVADAVARWNGSSCSAVGGGPGFRVMTLASFDDGRGEALYALGAFTLAGGVPAQNIARWDGSAWEALDAGLSSPVQAYDFDLEDADLGRGPHLFACGRFITAGGLPSVNLAAWNASRPWTGLDGSAAAGVTLTNRGLAPGAEVFNVFSLETCAGLAGSGPYFGLCATDPAFLVAQASYPLGTIPFHYAAPAAGSVTFGPYPLPAGLTFDALCATLTGGVLCPSPVRRFTVP